MLHNNLPKHCERGSNSSYKVATYYRLNYAIEIYTLEKVFELSISLTIYCTSVSTVFRFDV